MKPHLQLRLREGVKHSAVGSWVDAIADPATAGPPFQPDVDRVLLGHRGGVLIAHEHTPARTDGWSEDERITGLHRVFRVVSLSERPFSASLIEELAALPVVERVESGLVASSPLPVATALSRQPAEWAGELVALDEARRTTRGGAEVVIAVLDTGIDPTHREYADRLEPGFDFVDIIEGADDFIGDRLGADADPTDPKVGHGSHVTGILTAAGERMPTGVAPGCRVLPVRVLGSLRQGDHFIGAGLVDNINSGIKWAVDHGALVINMSLGIRREGSGLPHVDVIRYAQRKGVTVVAAAGNDGADTLYYPGALPGVLAVGSVDRDDHVAAYSTWGAQVDIVAPGTEIWSSWLEGGYAFATGTSQATPFVSGAVALCQSLAHDAGTRLSVADVTSILTATADRQDRHFKTARAGHGRLNVRDALALTSHRLRGTGHNGPLDRGRRRVPVPA